MGDRKQFVESEVLIGVIFLFGLDGIAALIDATGVGMAIAPVLQAFGTGSITMWMWSKGSKSAVKPGRQIVQHLANIIPFVPTVTLVFLVSTYLHNHPEKAGSLMAVVGKRAPKPATKLARGRGDGAQTEASPAVEEELELAS